MMRKTFSFTVEVPERIPREVVASALEFVGQDAALKFLDLMNAYDQGRESVALMPEDEDPAAFEPVQFQ